MYLRNLFVLFSLLYLASCQIGEDSHVVEITKYAESPHGVIATAHPLATQAGLKMLNEGGNAVDAAVAAGFALSVVEPSMSGLGGRLQAIVRTPEGVIVGVDASTEAPITYDKATATDAPYGYPIIGVPGVVAGLVKLHTDHGSMSFEDVIQPAIDLANNGYEVLPGAAIRFAMVKDVLMEFPGTKAYFIKDDTATYEAGSWLVQKDLGKTLEAIQKGGAEVFYQGEIGEKIVADMAENGGYVDAVSLAAYEARDAEIVRVTQDKLHRYLSCST